MENPELEVTVDEVAELVESAPESVVEPVAEVTVEEPVAKTNKGRKSEPELVVVEPTVEPEPEPVIEPVVEPAPAPIVEVTPPTAMRMSVK
jgi:hypothetical protein